MNKPGTPRVTEPERKQGVIRFEMPDDVLYAEHPARVLWKALPETLLADANHGDHAAIIDADARGVNVVIAVSKRTRESSAKADQRPAIVVWKARMETDEAKTLYRARPGLAEWSNARAAGRFNLRQLLVRGIERATSVALLTAITINLTQHLTTLAG
jgi:hypothetical protein